MQWLKPEIDSNDRTDWLAIIVPANSEELVELIAQGSCDYHLYFEDKDYLYAELRRYLRSIGKVTDSIFKIYCHGIYKIIGSNDVCVLISLNDDSDTKFSIDVELQEKVLKLWNQYQSEHNQWKNDKDEKQKMHLEKMPESLRQKFIDMQAASGCQPVSPTKPNYDHFLQWTSVGCWIPELPHQATARHNAILHTLASVDINPPRDGAYTIDIIRNIRNRIKINI